MTLENKSEEFKKAYYAGWRECERAKSNIDPETEGENARLIVNLVEQAYGIRIEQMKSVSHKAEIVVARHMAMYLLAKFTTLTLRAIAQILGRTDHTTVLRAKNKIAGFKQVDDVLAPEIKSLESVVRQRLSSKNPIGLKQVPVIKTLPRKPDCRTAPIIKMVRPKAEYTNIGGHLYIQQKLAE